MILQNYKLLSRLCLMLFMMLTIGACCSDDNVADHVNPIPSDSTRTVTEADFTRNLLAEDVAATVTSEVTQTPLSQNISILDGVFENNFGMPEAMRQNLMQMVKPEKMESTSCYSTLTYTYKSLSATGEEITLSSQLVYPTDATMDATDSRLRPKNVLMFCHSTIGSDADRPSAITTTGLTVENLSATLMTWGRHQALLVMPDFEGFGASADHVQPYLMQEAMARQMVDATKAALQIYEKMNLPALADDWTSIAVGASQGGAEAMAVQRFVENNNLVDRFHYAGTAATSGPYDIVSCLEHYCEQERHYLPVVFPYVLNALELYSPYMKGEYTSADYLSKDVMASGVVEASASGNYSNDTLIGMLAQYSLSNNNCLGFSADDYSFATSTLLQTEVTDYFLGKEVSDDVKKKCVAMVKAVSGNNNRLQIGWQPQHPILIFTSDMDNMVPCENSYEVQTEWQGNKYAHFFNAKKGGQVSTMLGGMTLNHTTTCAIFLLALSKQYFNYINDGQASALGYAMDV